MGTVRYSISFLLSVLENLGPKWAVIEYKTVIWQKRKKGKGRKKKVNVIRIKNIIKERYYYAQR